MSLAMRRCRCCRQYWPPECYTTARRRVDGTPILRASCEACRKGCGPAGIERRREVWRSTQAAYYRRNGVLVRERRRARYANALDRPVRQELGRPRMDAA